MHSQPAACPRHEGIDQSMLALDHVGLGIRDLAAAAAAFDRLGFSLSPLSMHAGAVAPGGPTVPWGSGNRCAMFRNGYFELLGLVDPSLPSNVKGMVDRYEGLHIVALDCDSADEAYSKLVEDGVQAIRPVKLERDAKYGTDDASVRRARFRNVYLDPVAHPEARFIVIEHETRDVLWQEHLLSHPNGVESLASVTLVVPEIQASLKRLRPLLGEPTQCNGAHRFQLRRGVVWVMDEAAMQRLCPVLRGERADRVAAACFGVRSLPALEDFLSERGVAFVPCDAWDGDQRSLWVGPSQAAHAAIQFTQLS